MSAAPDSLRRVVMVDDHALCRSGLTELLAARSALRIVASTGDPAEAIRMVREHKPDLVLLDLKLQSADGLAVLRQMRAEGLDAPVVILTMNDSHEQLAAALRAGARGYLLKDMEPEDVVAAIERAVRGELAVSPALTVKLAQLLTDRGPADKRSLITSLTERERQILDHLARGESNKTIARALDISHDTVKLHVRHILAKLNLGSRVEAAVFAVENRALDAAERARPDQR